LGSPSYNKKWDDSDARHGNHSAGAVLKLKRVLNTISVQSEGSDQAICNKVLELPCKVVPEFLHLEIDGVRMG
jgi:hypothetical protein